MANFLGEILFERGLITETQLAHALTLQQRSGSRLGDILIGQGVLDYYTLYNAIADYYGLPFVDLLKDPPDAQLLHQADADHYLRLQAIPWRGGDKIRIAICDPSPATAEWLHARFGKNVTLLITSPLDIRRTVESAFGDAMENASRLSLWEQRPHSSARVMAFPRQQYVLYGLLFSLLALALVKPDLTLFLVFAICHFAFAATMIFKCWVFSNGTGATFDRHWKKRLATLDERRLPVYTILLPMVRETAVLPKLLHAIQRLDYPASKLDIKIVLEHDDHETLRAVHKLKPPYQFEIIRVPPGDVRTKPRACNYALRFARGEFITVFDADDRPERRQLKKVVYAFRHSPENVICVQARLNYYNAGDNLLTCFFSLEYSILFNVMLYGLEKLGIPIPLGGTSNHIALNKLKELGEWDPYNVTEDADLGTRLAARGFGTAMIDSYTMEEATNTPCAWIRQRSRWIKGYMQTWLVHMRHPRELYRALGWKSFLGFQFFIGLSCFTFLMAPVVWAVSLLWAFSLALPSFALPAWLVGLTLANLFLNLSTHWCFALYCTRIYRQKMRRRIEIAAALYPFYMVLHSVASYKALWQLIVRPHFWEKTTHGLGRTDTAAAEDILVTHISPSEAENAMA